MRRQFAFAAALLLPTQAVLAQATGPAAMESGARGYWWYQAPATVEEEKPDPDALVKPVIPPMAELQPIKLSIVLL